MHVWLNALYWGLVTYSYAQYITADHCWSEVQSADQWSAVPVVRSTISADHIISIPMKSQRKNLCFQSISVGLCNND